MIRGGEESLRGRGGAESGVVFDGEVERGVLDLELEEGFEVLF